MQERLAILIDLDFFLRRYRRHVRDALSTDASPEEIAHYYAGLIRKHVEGHRKYKNQSHTLYRVYIYDSPPLNKKMEHPKTRESIDLSKSATAQMRNHLHDNIRQMPMTALRLGTLDESGAHWTLKNRKRYNKFLRGEITVDQIDEEEYRIEVTQKQVDMKIGIDITWLSLKQLVDRIVLISGDSDFVPAAKLARKEGITFILDPLRQQVRPELSEHIDLLRTPNILDEGKLA